MTRCLNIVGLGEAVLVEFPDRREVGGLGAAAALQSVRLGQRGICVTRVGQDEAGDAMVEMLDGLGVDTSHVQRDPDLPSGRTLVRANGERFERYLGKQAAFDNLQADFDLEDVAQVADAVVYGLLTRRSGQTRSEEERFLGVAAAAFKLFDLTHRDGDDTQRGQVRGGLELADAAIVDAAALRVVRPDLADASDDEALGHLRRDWGLQFAALTRVDPDKGQQRVTVVTGEGSESGSIPSGRQALVALLVALVHGVLRGLRPEAALDLATRVGAHAVAHPDERVPDEWRGVG